MTRRQALIIVSFLAVLLAPHHVLSEMPSLEVLVPKNVPDGWALREDPEMFTRETLFEHIDGQADLFVQYGFDTNSRSDAEYDMRSPALCGRGRWEE